MSEILCQWLNQELKVSQTVSEVSSAKLNNFSRLEPTLHLLGVQFDQNVAQSIMTEKPGAATKLLYQLYIALQKKKKSGMTRLEMQTMQPLTSNEIMAKIQAAIIQIPKPSSNRTLKALEAQKLMKKKKEAEDVANEIKKFEALIKKDLQTKESASKTSLDTAGQMTTELLNTYSDDDYIKKIQKRLEEDALAREQREKRRRRLLMDQLIAHEAQEEAYREEQLINRLMRQSQQERRIAVQLMHVRHEKEVLWQNRIFREKQYEERRLKNFQDALDREAPFFPSVCYLSLIPYKLMHDWKELFFNGKPIYEQAKIKSLPANPSEKQIIELEKRDLLDGKDYEEYKVQTDEDYFPIQILSIDTLVQEAIQAFHDKEEVSEALPVQQETEEKDLRGLQDSNEESQDQQNVFSKGPVSSEALPETEGKTILNTNERPKAEEVKMSDSFSKGIAEDWLRTLSIYGYLVAEQGPECQDQSDMKVDMTINKKLEEKETEKKEEASLAEASPPTPPPPPPPEPEKEKDISPQGEASKTHPAKGKPQSEPQHGKHETLQEGKGKKGDTSLKRKGSPKGKTQGGKQPVKKSPADSADVSPAPVVPPLPKPGSEEWVYVNEPIPEEIPSFLVPYWKLIESSYIKTIKTVLRYLREDKHTVIAYLYEIRTSFQHFLMRPDHKQNFVAHWQADFNSLPDDLWDDEETKAELHQRVNDLRDRLWDICDARKEEAEQQRLDIINESWLQDSIGISMNHFFSLMQAELSRFQDTKRLLQEYYRAMESKIPIEDNKKFIRVPLVQLDGKDIPESQLKIPLVPRISISPETAMSKPKIKTILKGKIDNSLENVELNFEADEKLVMDTWQQASLAISSMVAAEIHQRHMEEEKENQQADTKEKSIQTGANKKAKKEPKKQKADKKTKGKSSPTTEASAVVVTPEEIAEMERKNELRLKIKEEHLAALQFEEIATQFRLELIKTKALAFLEDLVTKVVDAYKLMEKWLGERYLNEMASVEKLTEVARYHIETSTRIQNELYLNQEDFFINGDTKVFPDSPPPIRPPPVEKEENGTLTIEQLDGLRNQFLDIAPKGIIGNKTFTDILLDLVTLNLGTNSFPSSWMHLTQPELQELTSLLIVNSEFVDWRKFLLLTSLPWPIPLEEELLETLQRFKTVDEEQLGMVTLEQYLQAGLWFTGDEEIKIPENPLEPLPFNRREYLIEFFFRLFADYEKDPPQLDYTQMLLYFACHPDAVEGVYRALSVAIGTHVFRRIKTSTLIVDKTFSFTDMSPVGVSPEPEENIREERELKEEKEEEIPENVNTEKISIETLLKVFQGGIEAQDCDRFASHLKAENIYYENFIKIFQDLGAKNLEPIEVAVLLKHPFIQDLISNYSDYKMPDIKIILQRGEHVQGSDGERSPSRLTEEKK
ncbi:sperm flagellar protein 2 [Trichechus manatus latirostris]|uniref:Sperm flagellar protein 2 n=1 Tax=Trichechus manatus latirostris TaxID=127582 RepID=A0A2Y9FZV2_TRIMA|nr:sperm flagellar protein 2 [Trichechus manatus latirostris]